MKNESKLSENQHGLSAIKRALLEKRLQAKNISHQIGLTNIPRRPQGQSPLSFSQQQLFFVDQLESDSAAYNFSIAVRLKGTLDIAVLEKSINEIICRHESLRTCFIIVNSEPFQQVLPELRLSVTVEDLTEPYGKNRFATLLSTESRTPFNLAECPLLRIRLFRLSKFTECDQEYVFVMTMPHIITDGWSGAVLQCR